MKSKYTFTEIDDMLKRPLKEKIIHSETIIEKRLNKRSVVACSGGKDSILLVYLARQYDPDVKIIYNDTGVEYPEVRPFLKSVKELWGLDLEILQPETTFWEVIKKYGWPHMRVEYKRGKRIGSSVPKCCLHLKEKPAKRFLQENKHKYDTIFLGITAAESRQRKYLMARFGSCYTTERTYGFPVTKVNPLMIWTPQDVWEFTRQNNLPVCPSYSKYGLERLGCWSCTAYKTWKAPLLKFAPKVYRRAMQERDNQSSLSEYVPEMII